MISKLVNYKVSTLPDGSGVKLFIHGINHHSSIHVIRPHKYPPKHKPKRRTEEEERHISAVYYLLSQVVPTCRNIKKIAANK